MLGDYQLIGGGCWEISSRWGGGVAGILPTGGGGVLGDYQQVGGGCWEIASRWEEVAGRKVRGGGANRQSMVDKTLG